MTKPLRVVDAVAEHDIPAIIDYHRPRSKAKAERIIAEYDHIVELLVVNPHVLPARPHGWRVYPFQTGTYLLYYREFETHWLVVGIFHALRDPRLDPFTSVGSRSGGVESSPPGLKPSAARRAARPGR